MRERGGVSPRGGERVLESVEGKRKGRKERKKEKIKNNNIIIWSRKSTVPEKSPKIPGGTKRHPEE